MSKTRIIGILMVIASLSQAGIDVLDGNGFDFYHHLDSFLGALTGLGFFFMRGSIAKVLESLNPQQKNVTKKKK